MSNKAQHYLPILLEDANPDAGISAGSGGVQLGDVVIHSEDHWESSEGLALYDLLTVTDGLDVNEDTHPDLYSLYYNGTTGKLETTETHDLALDVSNLRGFCTDESNCWLCINTYVVYRTDLQGNILDTLVAPYQFKGLAVDDNYVYALRAGSGGDYLYTYHKDTWILSATKNIEAINPAGIEVADGFLYIGGADFGKVYKYTLDGTQVEEVADFLAGSISYSEGLFLTNINSLYSDSWELVTELEVNGVGGVCLLSGGRYVGVYENHMELGNVIGSVLIEAIPNESGSTVPYKMVADYTGG